MLQNYSMFFYSTTKWLIFEPFCNKCPSLLMATYQVIGRVEWSPTTQCHVSLQCIIATLKIQAFMYDIKAFVILVSRASIGKITSIKNAEEIAE